MESRLRPSPPQRVRDLGSHGRILLANEPPEQGIGGSELVDPGQNHRQWQADGEPSLAALLPVL